MNSDNSKEVPSPSANQLQNMLSALTTSEEEKKLFNCSRDASEIANSDKLHVCLREKR